MRLFNFLGSLIKNGSGNSSKSFSLVMSTLITCFTSLFVCYVLAYDVTTNGFIKTDLESLGIFMLCMGGVIAGGSVSKIFGDRVEARVGKHLEVKDEEDETDYRMRRKERRGEEFPEKEEEIES